VNRRPRGTYLASSPLLEIRHLSISYVSSSGITRAVRDISLDVYEGETLALAGETGSGKSTLGLAVLGLLDPQARVTSGEILYEGCNLRSLKKGGWAGVRGRKIGIVFQDARSALNPVLTIKEHLIETLRAHQTLSGKDARVRALELLQEVGIDRRHEKLYPFELSGGMCQRMGIALAICNNPKLLIADEPTSSLDSTIQAQILDLLLSMKQRYGLALLLISHDLALIARVADRVSVTYHGRVVESGLKEEVFASPAHPYTQSLIQCLPGLQNHHETNPLTSIPGNVPVPGQDIPGCAFAPRCPDSGLECRETIPIKRQVSKTHWAACARDSGNRE
jgi:oligopeptide/dipeptide ABC transporter ATP-binding protein